MKESPDYTFYLDEYMAVREAYGIKAEDMPMIFYCFLRANIPTKASNEEIIEYIDSVWTNHEEKIYLIKTEAYRKFEEKFLNRTFKMEISKS